MLSINSKPRLNFVLGMLCMDLYAWHGFVWLAWICMLGMDFYARHGFRARHGFLCSAWISCSAWIFMLGMDFVLGMDFYAPHGFRAWHGFLCSAWIFMLSMDFYARHGFMHRFTLCKWDYVILLMEAHHTDSIMFYAMNEIQHTK